MLMSATPSLDALENPAEFRARHIGPSADEELQMLSVIGAASRRALIEAVVPRSIARARPMALPAPISEAQALAELRAVAAQNRVLKSFIGQGYHGTLTPGVIGRNILENPAWYTAYTPYQAEISQGRMEALVNFQTMVCDLTGMAIANASMLDEATAAAEAMTLAKRSVKSKSDTIVVAGDCHPQTIEVMRTRAAPLGLAVVLANSAEEWDRLIAGGDYFAVLLQMPTTDGSIHDVREDAARIHAHHAAFIIAADLLALTLIVPPGELWAPRSASACRWAPAARMQPTWPAATSTSAVCPAGWSASASMPTATPPTAWPCRRVNNTSDARRPRATSAPPRCCWP
jgi:glycine dehydrogenase